MEDRQIIALYFERSQQVIEETRSKYGKYCFSIAYNILFCKEDADELVSDTCMAAWNSIPPERPVMLSAFLGKITRRLSIDRWRAGTRKKRGGGQMKLSLDELEECIPDPNGVEHEIELKYLTFLLNDFLTKLPETEQKVFICRYWYLDPIASISLRFNFSESKVKSMLARTRKKLRSFLEKEGDFS